MSGSQSNAEMDALMALGELAHAASCVNNFNDDDGCDFNA